MRKAESRAESDYEPNLTQMAQAGCDLTIAAGPALADTTRKVAGAYPDRHFAIVDDDSVTADNVKPIVYDTAQAAFLAGYLAAGVSETGKVATYGGTEGPAAVVMAGFADGVEHYNKHKDAHVRVLGSDKDSRNGTFLDSSDSSGAGTVTRELIGDGADVVLPVAGQAARGTVDAVVEANGGARNVRLIWPGTDGYETLDNGRQYLLTSVLEDVPASVEDVVTEAANGRFDSTPYVGTLANGGVGLAGYHDQEDEVGDELDREVRQLKQDVIDGKLEVGSRNAPKA